MEGVVVKEQEAEEFLEINKVEKAIRSAASSGAIVFSVLIDAKELDAREPDPGSHGIIIFSTSLRRNLQMLTDADENWVPLGIAWYIAGARHLQVVPRKRFENRPQLAKYMEEIALSSLRDDPDLASIVRDWV